MPFSDGRNSAPVSPLSGALVAGTVAAAAATALWTAFKAREAESDEPAVGKFVEVDGVRLHYVERGQGVPIVLLHGNAVLLQDFLASGIVDKLAERHRVIVFDRPGFGFSERPRDRTWTPDAQAALLGHAFARLGIEQPVVLGHSWGTLVTLALALEGRVSLRGIVLVSGYYYPEPRFDAAMVAPVAMPVLGDVLRYTVSPVFGRLAFNKTIETMFAPRPVPAKFRDTLSRELMLRPGQIRANAEDAGCMMTAAARFESLYHGLHLPVRILAGAGDLVVDPRAHAVRLHRDLPDSELVVVPDVGHMVHYEACEQVVAAASQLADRPLREAVDAGR